MPTIMKWTLLFIFLCPGLGMAADAASRQKLDICLKKADELPDIAAANAEAWFWHGGGDAARLCHDYALFNSGDYNESGKGFAALAHVREKTSSRQAATLYAQAGLAYMRNKDMKKAGQYYDKAAALAPDSPEILTDRAIERIEDERYWDAITDLNQVLKFKPDMVDALRQRGRAWMQLGNQKNADADFQRAAALSGEDLSVLDTDLQAKK
jgi:tetratricopeptide (TPR) repeat protein